MNDVIYNACFDELKQIQKEAGILDVLKGAIKSYGKTTTAVGRGLARGLGGAALGATLGYGAARLSGAQHPWRYALLGGALGGAGGAFYPQLKSYGLRGWQKVRRLRGIEDLRG